MHIAIVSRQGQINKLYRHIIDLNRKVDKTQSYPQKSVSSPKRTDKTGDGTVINCINNSGETLYAYMCVRVGNGATSNDPPYIVLPEIDDDIELSLYGSLLNEVADGGTCFVKISGKMFFRIFHGSSLIWCGELLYPLENEVATKGLVCNKESNGNYIDLPIGRSLEKEEDRTVIVETIPVGGSNNGPDTAVTWVKASLESGSPSTSADGQTISVGERILILSGSNVGINLYESLIPLAWVKEGTPGIVGVSACTNRGKLIYIFNGASYLAPYAVYK